MESAYWLALSCQLLIPITFGSIFLIAQGGESPRRRFWYRAVFATGLLASGAIFLGNYRLAAAALFSFATAPAGQGDLSHYLRVAGPCALILVTVIAYRWTIGGVPPSDEVRNESRRESASRESPPRYLHENALLLLVLALVLVLDGLAANFERARLWISYADVRSVGDAVAVVVVFESLLPPVLASMIALHAAMSGWRKTPACWRPITPELPARRFAGIWLAVAAATLLGIAELATFGYAYWLWARPS